MENNMNSDNIKTGAQRAPHRSLLYALGLTKEELERPRLESGVLGKILRLDKLG